MEPYTQRVAKERFGSLMGPRLQNAPDDCDGRPEACYIPQLHPEIKPRRSTVKSGADFRTGIPLSWEINRL